MTEDIIKFSIFHVFNSVTRTANCEVLLVEKFEPETESEIASESRWLGGWLVSEPAYTVHEQERVGVSCVVAIAI